MAPNQPGLKSEVVLRREEKFRRGAIACKCKNTIWTLSQGPLASFLDVKLATINMQRPVKLATINMQKKFI